ncbi:MAG: ABC transporter substrate-binding protein [Chloroflexi bacterium]|nr:ABC transporter substrate-binding protein [Chloroflexota bacterium]
MRNRWTLAGITLVMTVALGAAACGGGEEATPTAAPTRAPTATAAPAPTAIPRPPATAAPIATAAPTPTARPAATPTTAPPPAQQAGKLRVALSSLGNERVQGSRALIATVRGYSGALFDWMTWANPDGSLAPGVLERWEMSADGKTWMLTVRSGMRFHNGDPLTVEDVKYTIETVVKDADIPERSSFAFAWKGSLAGSSLDVVSPTVLRITLARPWPLLPYDASVRQGPEGGIIPKGYHERVGSAGFAQKPVGTGPWQFVRHDPGIRFVFQAAPGKHAYRATPGYKELEVSVIQEESTRIASLKTGASDIVEVATFDAAANLQKERSLKVLTVPAVNVAYMVFPGWGDPRMASRPTAKKEVREALVLAVNRAEIISSLFRGLVDPAPRVLVAPGTLGYNPNWKQEPFDPARAKELMAAAGYPSGFPLQVWSYAAPGAAWMPQLAEAAAGYWANIGVKPNIVSADVGAFFPRMFARPQADDFIGTAYPLYGSITQTNLANLKTLYHSKGTTLVLPDSTLDAMIDAGLAELDPRKQQTQITQIADYIRAQHVDLPVALMPALYGVGPSVAEWTVIMSSGLGPIYETFRAK